MRQGANKRSRGRNGRNKPHIPLRMQTFDSSGPDVRIRGNAWQVHERYMNMARDAFQAGDRIAAENFFQHADHYYRLINMNEDGTPRHPQGQHGQHPQGPGGPQPGMEGGPEMGNEAPQMDRQGGERRMDQPRGPDQGGEMGPDGYEHEPRMNDGRMNEGRMNGRGPNDDGHGNRGPRDQQHREHQGRGRGGQDRGGQDRGGQDRERGDRPPRDQQRDQSREGLDRHLGRHGQERGEQRGERHANDAELIDEPRRHPAAD